MEWLGTWYQQQCNGRWEHQKGVLLEPLRTTASLDGRAPAVSSPDAAPGWRLRIDLRGTAAAGAAPRRFALCAIPGPLPSGWLRCTLNAQRFEGEGAEVESLIAVFRRWIDAEPPVLEAVSTG